MAKKKFHLGWFMNFVADIWNEPFSQRRDRRGTVSFTWKWRGPWSALASTTLWSKTSCAFRRRWEGPLKFI